MLELAKYGCCAVEELEVWQPMQNVVRSGYTVVWKLGLPAVGSAGNCLPPPAACTGGATSCTLVVEAEPAPIHAWIRSEERRVGKECGCQGRREAERTSTEELRR